MAEGIAAYKEFVGTLLDLTDNLDGERVVPPPNTVRHDGDDPYLVVAADKGTATFSDIANALSIEHGHWLGDAFASGGSQSATTTRRWASPPRGAWEAVKRHFREMDVDIQTTPFTVAGVGDMSGDVFGNGMLLSPATQLVAAFDHRDIFLDPDPDMAASLAERQRLFDLPRSSWQDYDKSLISKGGGVFPRSLKSIPLSPEVQALLGLEGRGGHARRGDARDPEGQGRPALVRRHRHLYPLVGGNGRAGRRPRQRRHPHHRRARSARRSSGEGANLGCTQLGRIEAARRGVRLNTDAIDNSAGVNTSDVEVNIKIALVGARARRQAGRRRRARRCSPR